MVLIRFNKPWEETWYDERSRLNNPQHNGLHPGGLEHIVEAVPINTNSSSSGLLQRALLSGISLLTIIYMVACGGSAKPTSTPTPPPKQEQSASQPPTLGSKVAFHSQGNNSQEIYLANMTTREVTQLTNDAFYDAQPSLSPDGSKIVFISNRNISSVPVEKEKAVVRDLQKHFDATFIKPPDFEAYNKYTSQQCRVKGYDQFLGEIYNFRTIYGDAKVSLKVRDIKFNSRADVAAVSLDMLMNGRSITPDGVTSVLVLEDGIWRSVEKNCTAYKDLLREVESPDPHRIWIMDIATKRMSYLTDTGIPQLFLSDTDASQGLTPLNPSWSKDGKKLIFRGLLGGIYYLDLYNGNSILKLADAVGNIRTVNMGDQSYLDDSSFYTRFGPNRDQSFSPDGAKILYWSDGIWTMNSDGSNSLKLRERRELLKEPDWYRVFGSLDWSVNGEILAIMTEGSERSKEYSNGIVVMPSDWSDPMKIVWGSAQLIGERVLSPRYLEATWSQDGKVIFYERNTLGQRANEFFVVDPQSGAPTNLTAFKWTSISKPPTVVSLGELLGIKGKQPYTK